MTAGVAKSREKWPSPLQSAWARSGAAFGQAAVALPYFPRFRGIKTLRPDRFPSLPLSSAQRAITLSCNTKTGIRHRPTSVAFVVLDGLVQGLKSLTALALVFRRVSVREIGVRGWHGWKSSAWHGEYSRLRMIEVDLVC